MVQPIRCDLIGRCMITPAKCFLQPGRFAWCQFGILRSKKTPNNKMYMPDQKTLYMLIGPKGSGKTHIGKLVDRHTGIVFLQVRADLVNFATRRGRLEKGRGSDRCVIPEP